MKQAKNIEEVIQMLDEIVESSRVKESSNGYFAALYRLVTIKVRKGIEEDFFDDGDRMERLDVIFANRYLEAYFAYQNGDRVTHSWQRAFDLSTRYWPIVMQHLLVGMNAHINLDLGIAATQVMKGSDIADLEDDFNKINEVLAALVHKVQQDLVDIWPTLGYLLKLTGRLDDFITDFSMQLARDGAWKFANALATIPEPNRNKFIEQRDHKIAANTRIISNPGFLISSLFKIIRLGEKGSVADKIENLST